MKTHIDKLILEPFQLLGETQSAILIATLCFVDTPVDYPL